MRSARWPPPAWRSSPTPAITACSRACPRPSWPTIWPAPRAELARELGGPRYAIAYPVGRSIAGYPEVRAAVAAAGYRLGFTNASGRLRVVGRPGLDRLDLARVAVDRDLPDAVFLAQLTSDRFGFVRRAPSP
jgi:hypothetical protein